MKAFWKMPSPFYVKGEVISENALTFYFKPEGIFEKALGFEVKLQFLRLFFRTIPKIVAEAIHRSI